MRSFSCGWTLSRPEKDRVFQGTENEISNSQENINFMSTCTYAEKKIIQITKISLHFSTDLQAIKPDKNHRIYEILIKSQLMKLFNNISKIPLTLMSIHCVTRRGTASTSPLSYQCRYPIVTGQAKLSQVSPYWLGTLR